MTRREDNHVVIAGVVDGPGRTRHSPAGLPMTRFFLNHRSHQTEAGHPREARARLLVLACGEPLASHAQGLDPGAAVRVRGFLSRANHRQGEHWLVLHAECIEILPDIEE